jgi:hypothetical protein
MPNIGTFWTTEELAWFAEHPDGTYWQFSNEFGSSHSFDGWRIKRGKERRRPDLRVVPHMPEVAWDKHEIDFSWRDLIAPTEELQAIVKAASGSQDHATITVSSTRPVAIALLSDWHFGSWGVSLRKLATATDKLLKSGCYIGVIGDMLQNAIILRNVLEVSDNLIPPRVQQRVLDGWLADIAEKLLFSTWDNHNVERQEKAIGFSPYAEAFREKAIYHNGIGHLDVMVNGQVYKLAVSHRFRGNSYLNPVHGQMRYGRVEGQDRDIMIAGDSHVPAITHYYESGRRKLAINIGSMQQDSGYAKRYFSLHSSDAMPVLVLDPHKHRATAYWDIDEWQASHREPSQSIPGHSGPTHADP